MIVDLVNGEVSVLLTEVYSFIIFLHYRKIADSILCGNLGHPSTYNVNDE